MHGFYSRKPNPACRMIKKLKLQVAARSKAVEVMKNKIADGCPRIDREQVSARVDGRGVVHMEMVLVDRPVLCVMYMLALV